MGEVNNADRVALVCRVDALMTGDEVLTPAHRWETILGLDRGERYTRSTRIRTDATGPDHPWEWVNRHPIRARRRRPASSPVDRAA